MARARGFSPLRDLPTVGWLIAALGAALAHAWIPAPRWLMIHLLLLGAVTHSILVWSQHFADALLHTRPRPGDARTRTARLALLSAGVAAVVTGVPARVWPLTVVGASAVAVAVGWHAGALVRQLRQALPARFAVTVHYYVASAALLPLGALLGVLMARGPDDALEVREVVAHATVNVLGWMGLTVVGTLVTLWPTILRTQIAGNAERRARQALPVLLAGVLVSAGGALVGSRAVAAAGLAGYLVGLLLVAVPFVATARAKTPGDYASRSVLAAIAWLTGCVAAMAIGVPAAPDWHEAHERVEWLTPALAAGFGAQVLLGALSYLVPVVLGGGPTPVRAATSVLSRGGTARLVAVNAGLLAGLVPAPGPVHVLSWTVVAVGLASFLPLMMLAMRASRRARADLAAAAPTAPAAQTAVPDGRG